MPKGRAKSAPKIRGSGLVIRRTDTIGTGDSETDQSFQEACFVDTGVLEALCDTERSERIILGRTGSGKTLLVKQMLENEANVIEIEPSSLAMQYVSNSTMIRFAEENGAHLDAFFYFLWLHVITVELLKRRYGISTQAAKRTLWGRFVDSLSPTKQKAFEYVGEYGDKFWEETEERVKEFTDKVEKQLSAALSVGQNIGGTLSAGGSKNLTKEQRIELVRRAKDVVNRIQMAKLAQIVKALSEDVFSDRQNRFYVVIDGLDEEWAEDIVRYRLIKALIDVVRKLVSVRNVKVIICLRTDLLYKVIEETKTTGAQEEKYEPLLLKLRWTEDQLAELLEKRIGELFKRKYTGARVGYEDVLPQGQIDRKPALDYILSRTLKRPRDVIHFFNECLNLAEGRTRFSTEIIRTAERSYSEKRLRSLRDEWRSVYPNLGDYISVLPKEKNSFTIGDIDKQSLESFISKSSEETERVHGPMYPRVANWFSGGQLTIEDLSLDILYHLYVVGLVGVKLDSRSSTHWSFEDSIPLGRVAFKNDCAFFVHPVFWFALGMA